MSEMLTVRGTIELRGVEIYVRFADESPSELLGLGIRQFLERFKVPGPLPKGGEQGSFIVRIQDRIVTVVGTHLDGREPYDEASAPTPLGPSNRATRRNVGSEVAGTSGITPVSETGSESTSGLPGSATSGPPLSTDGRFIHAYNFVRQPRDGLSIARAEPPFQRGESRPHDRYCADTLTGYVTCVLTTKTPLFIPDPRKVDPQKHKTLGYFTLDNVTSRSRKDAVTDTTRPAIPASSLRGMVRSVFEAATLSCYSVFDSGRLDFRIGYSPDHRVDATAGNMRSSARYVPCRVVAVGDEQATIQLLDGRYERADDLPVVINSALVRAYRNKVVSGEGPEPQWESIGDAPDGSLVVAYLVHSLKTKDTKKYRWRAARDPLVIGRGDDLPAIDNGDRIAPIVEHITGWVAEHGAESQNEYLIFGFLHRTGPNWREKKDERVFFDAHASYNDPQHPDFTNGVKERMIAFLTDQGKRLDISADVFRECIDALWGYSKRGGKKLRREFEQPPRQMQPDGKSPTGWSNRPLPSDFVLRRASDVCIQFGDLFYALVEERPAQLEVVRGLYPVAIPRLSHEHSRGDLLHDDFYPCSRRHEKCPRCYDLSTEGRLCDDCQNSWRRLCPACRVFGWTRDLAHYRRTELEQLRGDADRVDALAGHVRFTHGVLDGSWNDAQGRRAAVVTLPILSSPNATATGFYLEPHVDPHGPDWNAVLAARWPPVTGLDNSRNPVARLPAYRKSEAQLGGRKMYRRHLSADALTARHAPQPTEQNQTVHLLPPELSFSFRVYFDNLTQEELGALLFALTLNVPNGWKSQHGSMPADAEFCHAVGHGKPLGMGRCTIQVNSISLEGAERYAAESFQVGADAAKARPLNQSDFDTFFDAWDRLGADPDLIHVRSELLEMLLTVPAGESIAYPPVLLRNGSADFKWWKEAKSKGIMLPEPVNERTNPNERLKR